MTIYGDIVGSADRAARRLGFSRTRTVAPTLEPVTLAELRAHARIDTAQTDDDATLTANITAAIEHIERLCGIAMMTQTWKFYLDAFPSDDQPLYVPRPPLQSVTSIQYIDENGVTQTLSSSDYKLDTAKDPGSWPNRVALAYNETWPSTREETNAVTITAVCGFATVAEVPSALKRAIMMLALYWYEHRAAAEFLQGAEVKHIPYAIQSLVSDFRVRRFA